MKTVLITGASGFIGRHLARHLGTCDYLVHVVNRRGTGMCEYEHLWDGADSERFAAIIEQARPHFVIHLASRAQPCRDLRNIPVQFDDTVKPALAVVQALPKTIDLAIFFGAAEEYGDGPSPSHEDQGPRSISSYGWAKISAFHGVAMVASQRNIPWCWARPYLVFGPGQSTDRMIPQVISGCLRGEDVPLSPGQQTRDLLYVEDLCRMVERILNFPERADGQIVNLCTGRPTRVADAALLIRRLVGRGNLQIGALPYRTREVMALYGSPEKFHSHFGEFTPTDLEAALANTIHAYQQEFGLMS